jgi:glycosyltransferase involved in cell wall biosynthesis
MHARSAGRTLVSVVIPVFNAGSYLERCSASLLHQSIGADAYEVIYVDDGSTDGSADVLDRLAAEHPHVRVHHQENSGWPGKPRNVGIDLARGEYIQFVDHDDELGPEALERLYALGSRNDSDIVLGKLAGSMVGPRRLFKRTLERCTLTDSDAIESLTGHKMFRRDFLVENDIRFPEGYWRMEDLLFVARAYGKARTMSILGDYPCYFWNRREDGGNNSTADFELAGHYERLRIIIDTFASLLPPGPARDRALRRVYRVEVMQYVSGGRILESEEQGQREAYELSRSVARECFPPEIRRGLPPLQQLRGAVLEEGTWAELRLLEERRQRVRPKVRVRRAAFQDGALQLRLHAFWTWEGERLRVRESEGAFAFLPEFTDGLEGLGPVRFPDPLDGAFGDVVVHDLARDVWWWANCEMKPRLQEEDDQTFSAVLEGDVTLDPARLAGGEPLLPGKYEVWFSGQLLGEGRRPRLRAGSKRRPPGSVLVGSPPMLVKAEWAAPSGQLVLTVRDGAAWVAEQLVKSAPRSARSLPWSREPLSVPVRLPGRDGPGFDVVTLAEDPLSVRLRRGSGRTGHLEIGRRTALATGRHPVVLGGRTVGRVHVAAGRVLQFTSAPAGPPASGGEDR